MTKTFPPLLLTIASFALALPAHAADYAVLGLTDGPPAPCIGAPPSFSCASLRDAITAANGTGIADTVTLQVGVYTLSRAGYEDGNNYGDLDIDPLGGPLTVQGVDRTATSVDAIPLALTLPDRVFHVLPGAILHLRDLEVTNGRVSDPVYFPAHGGGVLNEGIATLEYVDLRNNRVDGLYKRDGGGGIANSGTLIMHEILVENNVVWEASGGGVHTLAGGTATITRSTIRNNSAFFGWGGGLSARGAATVTGVGIDGNTADWGGGGVYADNNGAGVLSINNSSVTNNAINPGAIDGGGGILVDRPTTVVSVNDSTISGNLAPTSVGGGLRARGAAVTLTHVTHAANLDAVGIGVDCTGAMCTFNESVVTDQCAVMVPWFGANLEPFSSCNGGGWIFAPAMLGPLSPVVGTHTLGHYPLPGSPLTGASWLCGAPDQSFAARPMPCTIGALE